MKSARQLAEIVATATTRRRSISHNTKVARRAPHDALPASQAVISYNQLGVPPSRVIAGDSIGKQRAVAVACVAMTAEPLTPATESGAAISPN